MSRRSRSWPLSASQAWCFAIASITSSMPSPRDATVRTIGGFQSSGSRFSASAIIVRISRTVSEAPSRSALLTTKMSAISRMPAFAACTASPIPGASSTSVVSAADAISTSDCPTPTVSISTISNPAASSTRTPCRVAAASPPRCPRDAMDRMKTSGSLACSCMRTRSPSSAPPEKGEDGSTATTPTRLPSLRYSRSIAEVVVDFPTPGDPVSPTTVARAAPVANAAINSRTPGRAFSTIVSARAIARGSRSATARGDHSPVDSLCATRTISASPWPPPPHRAAAPMPPPRRPSSRARLSTSRAPDIPIG